MTQANSVRPFALFLDFDGTMTVDDTTSTLAAYVGYVTNSQKYLPKWSFFLESYAADKVAFDHHERSPLSAPAGHPTRQVEEMSVNRVFNSGLFDNVTEAEIRRGAAAAVRSEAVRFRKGTWKLLRTAWNLVPQADVNGLGDSGINIVSANWSQTWIRECLRAGGGEVFAHAFSENINANEIPSLDSDFPTLLEKMPDYKYGRVLDARDKYGGFDTTVRRMRPTPQKTIYIGDSLTDYECLVKADVGICICDEPMRSGQIELAQALKKSGKPVVWIGEARKKASELPEKWLLYARDLKKVEEWLRYTFGEDS